MERVEKPWGHEIIWAKTKDYVGKILFIKKEHMLSLQYHCVKEETIIVETGVLKLLLEDEAGSLQTYLMHPGDTKHIAPNKKHRMIAQEDCRIYEVSTNHLQDIVRLEDHYGRK